MKAPRQTNLDVAATPSEFMERLRRRRVNTKAEQSFVNDIILEASRKFLARHRRSPDVWNQLINVILSSSPIP